MKNTLILWGEKYLFSPGPFETFLSILILPLSWMYCLIVWLKYKTAHEIDFDIPIVSVGNLIVGGSGKTPVTVALASRYEKAAVVLRGYGRASTGMQVVSDGEKILCDVSVSGDEAMLYATLLKKAIVIVAEDRKEGIKEAKKRGAELVFLDDAYSKHFIKKLDLLIVSDLYNRACLPSGPYRERLWADKEVIKLEEQKDFIRKVKISNERNRMVLVTAISKPQRLDPYLPQSLIDKVYFPDHYAFKKEELEEILEVFQADSLLVTHKDAVKLQEFSLELSFLDLEIELNESIHQRVQEYVKIAPIKP